MQRKVYRVKKINNNNLQSAKKTKNDEFYTQLSDIENELKHYKHHFRDKVVYCNCDDPRVSNFFHYFSYNFEHLGLKRLIATCYKSKSMDLFSQNDSEQAVCLIYDGDKNGNNVPDQDEIEAQLLDGDGDFRSDECVELLKQADIVVTNPPFSLFREYITQLIEYDKKFLVIGNSNSITYKGIFPAIKENKMWLGYNCVRWFQTPSGELYEAARSFWYTNLEHNKRNEELILWKTYNPDDYPKYDNYDAINISKVVEMPIDYDGVMGVPITFLTKYNPEQFEIVGATESEGKGFSEGLWHSESGVAQATINGKKVYKRLFIKNRKPI